MRSHEKAPAAGFSTRKARAGEGGTTMRHAFLAGCLLFALFAAVAKDRPAAAQTAAARTAHAQIEFPATYIPSGEITYKQFCGACHGVGAKGDGPVAMTLRMPPSNLTTLAKRHQGKFPYDYVSEVVRFGPGSSAHGSSEMPTWGPVFRVLDKGNERVVQQRIKNLCDYLASLQEK
jgi:mono/diheme cytochrome c family protein